DQGDLSAGSNYTIDFTGANLVINPASLTITAAGQSKTYGTLADPELSYGTSGLVNGDTSAIITGSLHRAPGQDAGSYAIDQGDL
ncbi:MAG TPA: hemagglutination activity domain-containing protein, partial [Geobacter sp.]|nr:hemagglutination activity domain-containing protein [Geobacter sp.]